MKRRKFLKCAALSSAALPASHAFSQSKESGKRVKCKITVLKRTVNEDYYLKYKKRKGNLCPIFKDGQEFIVDSPWAPPGKFCQWAWADIRTYIIGVFSGMKFDGSDVFVACCTDGFKPVFFKIERVE
jgi:uncharacterized repeat protein (TIGR04076 family)